VYEYVAVGAATLAAGDGPADGASGEGFDGAGEGSCGDVAGDGSVTEVCATGVGCVDPGSCVPVSELPQYRQRMASSWISSAQYGHFFTSVLRGAWCLEG
jgi:hypothetical protein